MTDTPLHQQVSAKDTPVRARIPPQTWSALRSYSRKHDISISAIVRDALNNFLLSSYPTTALSDISTPENTPLQPHKKTPWNGGQMVDVHARNQALKSIDQARHRSLGLKDKPGS